MDVAVKAIETTGTIDADIDEKEWLYAAASNPAFDFLKEAEEDIYTSEDGRPFHDR